MDKSKEKQQSIAITIGNGSGDSSNTPKNKPKEKRRSNEKRKEKSRDAARCRRSRETEIFTELGHVLPLRREDVEQLDKASIMRLSIAFLKVREMLKLFPKIKEIKTEKFEDNNSEKEMKLFDVLNGAGGNKLLTQAMDGFLVILSNEGDVTYVSENIAEYLGISQIDILGQQIWEYSHQCDHDELKEALNFRRSPGSNDSNEDNSKLNKDGEDDLKTAHRDFYIRFKCTLTSRGRSVNIKSASYKVIHMTGHVIMNNEGERILIAVGRPLPHPSNIEVPLGSTTFLTKHSLDMKFTYADENMLSLLGYRPEDLLGKSLYDCHYAADSESLMATFKSVLSKGQGETNRYRFLGKYGGYTWVVTQATIVYDKQKPQSVVCVNYAISNLENDNEIYSCNQLEASNQKKETLIQANGDHQQDNLEQQEQQNQVQQQQQQTQQKLQQKSTQNKLPSVENLSEKLLPPSSNSVKSCYQVVQLKKQQTINQKTLLQNQNLQSKNQVQENNPAIVVLRGSKPEGIKCENRINRDSSLSPIRQTFKKCSISSGIERNIISKPVSVPRGPKTVTASVFKKVSIAPSKLSFTSVNTAPKPQSVTTSVLTPISNLSKPLNRSFISGGGNPKGYNSILISNKINQQQQQQRQIQRSEDMNKGFPMFLDDPTELTMLKEEPDDLTHLAPAAGDTCIPLDESTPLFGEMLEGFILPDSYGSLLPDDINSLDSQQSNNNSNCNSSKTHIDPFINYRDESSDTTGSPHLLSPGASKSPEVSSIPSLCSPHSLSQEDEFAFMTMNDEIDLSMRAPYIPMNEQEDLPLLTEDLMWSAFSEELHKDIKEALQIEIKNNMINGSLYNNSNSRLNSTTSSNNSSNDASNESSLAALLCSSNSIQQQQHQQQSHVNNQQRHETQDSILGQVNESNKKRKFDLSDTNTSALTDSIDAFGQVFNKNSPNMDCWTINELLQINPSSLSTEATAATTTQSENIQSEKQSVIVNAAIPTTFNVPLVTLQQHNNIGNKISLTRSSSIGSISSSKTIKGGGIEGGDDINIGGGGGGDGGGGGGDGGRGRIEIKVEDQPSNKNLNMTKILTTSNMSRNVKQISANINITNSDINNITACNKRHLTVSSSLDSKRVKNSSSVEIQTSPQLLQQLMAPTPQKQKGKILLEKSQNSRWNSESSGGQTISNNNTNNNNNNSSNMSSSPSNSVLKNLLVSGCDESFTSQPDITVSNENSNDSSTHDYQLSPGSNYSKPLNCKTSAELSRLCGSNPMIGGSGILPSPPIPIPTGGTGLILDSNKGNNNNNKGNRMASSMNYHSNLNVINDSDSGSDSGIECNRRRNSFSLPTKSFESRTPPEFISKMTSVLNPTKGIDTTPSIDLYGDDSMSMSGDEAPPPLELTETAMSTYPFMDSGNPICSPFLMELCTDDYAMTDLLQDNEITKVLNELNSEMT